MDDDDVSGLVAYSDKLAELERDYLGHALFPPDWEGTEAWTRMIEAGNEFMRCAEADRHRLAEEMGVTPEDLDHFTRTLDYDWLARRVVAGGKADALLNRGHPR